ncbi:GDP-mannose mannosyl hydrolase [Scandinavium manionii]|uniref:GDP-mannose mannosyl hydrolase n=1 Tax=Scandinavium manionii TaxID=2926520 RepID=UPI002165CB53|nr:GDP-mannose mannosyl hydrolase [Scandinavium manionii]MCS2150043.1 GDP-mannose mannosyl hydrolase [Scandinavium manionii]
MRLEEHVFKCIVANTPLISIDLIIRNTEGKVLLGQRQNRPAKDFWFVPGGRIFKDESFEIAFQRITKEELGLKLNLTYTTFLGIYEHFYDDNFSEANFSTHYVVLGYELFVDDLRAELPHTQHSSYKWFDEDTISDDPTVHQYTKNYFLSR